MWAIGTNSSTRLLKHACWKLQWKRQILKERILYPFVLCMCMWSYACPCRGQMIAVFFYGSLPSFPQAVFLLNWKFSVSVRLAGQKAPRICPSIPNTRIAVMYNKPVFKSVDAGDLNTGFHICTSSIVAHWATIPNLKIF